MNSVPIPTTPRSALHALAAIGLGTPDVESLTSYFCRLANSHACTTSDLAKFVVERIDPGRWETHQGDPHKCRYTWHERSISGIGPSALSWASALAQLTGVGSLSQLTLLALQGCVTPKGLMAVQSRWCPHCLHEDLAQGRTPYLRLAWDIGIVKICARHGVPLWARCPHCKKSNVRHSANVVVPGWCTSCGHFLGQEPPAAEPSPCQEERTRALAMQTGLVGELLAATSSGEQDSQEIRFTPGIDALHRCIDGLITRLDGGMAAQFARRLGVSKSTVHYWRIRRSPPTLAALVHVALACNISMVRLVQGDLSGWSPPDAAGQQLALALGERVQASAQQPKRRHDWQVIRQMMRDALHEPEPPSVAQVAQSLQLDVRLLYLHATQEARCLAARHRHILQERSRAHQQQLHGELLQACQAIEAEGSGVSARRVREFVDENTLNETRSLYSVLSRLAQVAANDAGANRRRGPTS